MNLKMTGEADANSGDRAVVNTWSDRPWAEPPPAERPESAVRVGLGWVEPTREGSPMGPVGRPRWARDRHRHPESLIVDPSSPDVRDFLQGATLGGLIRTVPAGPGRVLILPSDLWSRGQGFDVAG